MSTRFNAKRGLVLVHARIWGPSGRRAVRLALDTGATTTVINAAILVDVGYDPGSAPSRVRMTTGSGIEYVPRIKIERIRALRSERTDFEVVCHTLPPTASVDGLLGLDFLRDCRLTIDFRAGEVSLE